jgi:hypothetical protein
LIRISTHAWSAPAWRPAKFTGYKHVSCLAHPWITAHEAVGTCQGRQSGVFSETTFKANLATPRKASWIKRGKQLRLELRLEIELASIRPPRLRLTVRIWLFKVGGSASRTYSNYCSFSNGATSPQLRLHRWWAARIIQRSNGWASVPVVQYSRLTG